jgi:hypothetical protein
MGSKGAPRMIMMAGATFLWLLAVSCHDPSSTCGGDWPPKKLPERNSDRVSILQGIWGDVWFWEGNFMPPCGGGSITAVGREMRVYELTSITDVSGVGPFFGDIRTALLATVWSDADGFFQVQLPPGRYSLFAIENSVLYAPQGDGDGHIWPVDVVPGAVTEIRFDITYRAAQKTAPSWERPANSVLQPTAPREGHG